MSNVFQFNRNQLKALSKKSKIMCDMTLAQPRRLNSDDILKIIFCSSLEKHFMFFFPALPSSAETTMNEICSFHPSTSILSGKVSRWKKKLSLWIDMRR